MTGFYMKRNTGLILVKIKNTMKHNQTYNRDNFWKSEMALCQIFVFIKKHFQSKFNTQLKL